MNPLGDHHSQRKSKNINPRTSSTDRAVGSLNETSQCETSEQSTLLSIEKSL